MKDAKGHGSDAGTHAAGTQATPKLQRRHFEAIAAELKAKNATPEEVKAMAAKLATTNPGFRADFFIKAATGGDYKFKGPGNDAAAVSRKASKATGQLNSAPKNTSAAYAAGTARHREIRNQGWGDEGRTGTSTPGTILSGTGSVQYRGRDMWGRTEADLVKDYGGKGRKR